MNIYTAGVLIVAIWALVSIIRSRQNSAAGYGTDGRGDPVGNPAREAELEHEIAELHERIKVLERIATEDTEAKRLSSEIDRLREDKS